MLSEFTHTNKLAYDIRQGFDECLETGDIESAFENGDEIELIIKEEIIKLLE